MDQTAYTLPPYFEERRENLYDNKSRLDQAVSMPGQHTARDTYIDRYIGDMNYIISRIQPKLKGDDILHIRSIRRFAKSFYKTHRDNPGPWVDELEGYHNTLCEILNRYDFDTIHKHELSVG